MIRTLLLISFGAAAFIAVYVVLSPLGLPPNAVNNPAESPTPAAHEEVATVPPSIPDEIETASILTDATSSVGFELRPGAEPPAPNVKPVEAIRDVTPDNMTAGPKVTGTLARVDPPAPAPQGRTERLFNPIVIAAGTIKARGADIHLAGIAATGFETMCGTGAAAWPCGRLARAALRSFIHGRAIECKLPPGADKIPDPANCLVGGDDISDWLVARGWAKRSGSDFADAEKKAKDEKLGLWSDRRPDGQPGAVAAGD